MEYICIIIISLLSAFIGTFLGAKFLYKEQESKIKKVRDIAIRGLNIFKLYDGKPYCAATNQFNNELNISEKRAALVALHKIGIPLEIPSLNIFDIKSINLKNATIDKIEIDAMVAQIEKGHCDNLFFSDVDAYITTNQKILAFRSIAKKFVNEVLSKSKLANTNIIYADDLFLHFSYGEIQNILVFKERLANQYYYLKNGDIDHNKIIELLKEIDIGIWDGYLSWDYEAYQSMKSQTEIFHLLNNIQLNKLP